MRLLSLVVLWVSVALAADEVDTYFFGFLRNAPGRATLPKEEMVELQKAHLAHLNAMAEGWKIHREKPAALAEDATVYEWFCAEGTLPPVK